MIHIFQLLQLAKWHVSYEATLTSTSEEINPVALAIVELLFSGDIS